MCRVLVLVAVACKSAPIAPAPAPTPARALAPPVAVHWVDGPEPAHLQIVRAHVGVVTQLVWSHDGKRLATAARGDASVRIWDVASGQLLRTITERAFTFERVGWSADDTAIVYAGYGAGYQHAARTVVLDSGERTNVVLADGDKVIAVLPDDRVLVETYQDLAIARRDGSARTPIEKGHVDPLHLAVAPDGSTFATAKQQTLQVWTVADGKLHEIAVGAYVDTVYPLAGGRVAVRTRDALVTYDAASGSQLATRSATKLLALALAGDAHVATADLDHLTLGPDRRLPLGGLDGNVRLMTFAPDAARLAVASERGTISIVDVAGARVVQRLGHAPALAHIADFIDEDHVLIATTRGLVTFDLGSARLTGELPVGPPLAAGTVRDGAVGFVFAGQQALELRRGQLDHQPCEFVMAPSLGADSHLSLWAHRGTELPAVASDALGTRALKVVRAHAAEPPPPSTSDAGGDRLNAGGDRDRWPRAVRTCLPATPLQFFGAADPRDLATGSLIVVEKQQNAPTRLGIAAIAPTVGGGDAAIRWFEPARQYWDWGALSAQAPRLVAVGRDGLDASEVMVWNKDGTRVLSIPGLPSGTRAVLSPDGKRLAIATPGGFAVVEVDRGPQAITASDAILLPARAGQPRGVFPTALAVSDDGVAVVGGLGGELVVVANKTATAFDAGQSRQIAIAPSGKRALALVDGAVQIWSVTAHPQLLATLHLFADGEWIAIAPDGLYESSFEASRRIAWQFDKPLASVDLERYGARYHVPARLAARLHGGADAAMGLPLRPPVLGWARPPRRAAGNLHGELSVTGGSEVLVFADGIAIGRAPVASGKARVSLPLPAGARRVVATSYASDGLASSSIEADLGAGDRTTGRPKLWIVAVGVSDYPGLPRAAQLRFADDDAHSIVEAFAPHVGPGRTYREVHTRLLVDEAATQEAVTAALDELANMAPDDVAIVSFAGHGVLVDGVALMVLGATDLDAANGPAPALAWTAAARSLAKARGRVLVLLDACHAGAIANDALAANADVAGTLVQRGRAGMVVLAAAKGRESSLENASGGLFTQAVIATLRVDRDLYVSDLVTGVQSAVAAASNNRQTPWLVRADVFGDFPLVSARR